MIKNIGTTYPGHIPIGFQQGVNQCISQTGGSSTDECFVHPYKSFDLISWNEIRLNTIGQINPAIKTPVWVGIRPKLGTGLSREMGEEMNSSRLFKGK